LANQQDAPTPTPGVFGFWAKSAEAHEKKWVEFLESAKECASACKQRMPKCNGIIEMCTLSRKVGVYGPDKIGTYDRKGCGGQTEGSYRINEN